MENEGKTGFEDNTFNTSKSQLIKLLISKAIFFFGGGVFVGTKI
jgi:hypothetical protein